MEPKLKDQASIARRRFINRQNSIKVTIMDNLPPPKFFSKHNFTFNNEFQNRVYKTWTVREWKVKVLEHVQVNRRNKVHKYKQMQLPNYAMGMYHNEMFNTDNANEVEEDENQFNADSLILKE